MELENFFNIIDFDNDSIALALTSSSVAATLLEGEQLILHSSCR
jgi:hypothetical protein